MRFDCGYGLDKYEGGTVSQFMFVDIDRMSIQVLNNMMTKELGYSTGCDYYMDAPEGKVIWIELDGQLLERVAENLKTSWEVNIYCDHPVAPLLIQNSVGEDDEDHHVDVVAEQEEHEDPGPEPVINDHLSDLVASDSDAQGDIEEEDREEVDEEAQNDMDEQTWEAYQRRPTENEFGFELSDEEIEVDGAAVDLGLAGVVKKGKGVLIDDSEDDSDYNIDADIGGNGSDSEDNPAEEVRDKILEFKNIIAFWYNRISFTILHFGIIANDNQSSNS